MATALAAVVLTAGACTGGDEPDDEGSSSRGGRAEDRLATTARIGQVVGGKVATAARKRLAGQVSAVVDDWIDAAYVGGDYPRSDFDGAFRAFTDGAARLAADQRAVMSNQALGKRLDGVTATRREVVVDVLAPGGEPAGATARVTLVLDLDGEVDRTDKVSGRLLLSPGGKDGWQVFGFDVQRGKVRGR